MVNRSVLAAAILAAAALRPAAAPMPIFDAHIHYSEDAWATLSPQEAVARLRDAGIVRALVSSSPDEGTQRLLAAAPDLVVPELRPYRTLGEQATWVREPGIVPYVEERLAQHRYAGIGELHVFGADADLPVMRAMVSLARARGLFLHVHGDAEAVERIFRQDPSARVLWAHAGFEAAAAVRSMLARHATLWADLAFRPDIAPAGRLEPQWRDLLSEMPDRFLVGTDTYTPGRWSEPAPNAVWERQWLDSLPRGAAELIAWRNGERLFTAPFRAARQ